MKSKFIKPATSFMKSLVGQFEDPKPNSLLYNRALLYCILFLSLFQLYTFSISGNTGLAVAFLLVGFLTSFFSKNMIVILFIALAFTGVMQYGVGNNNVEGMQIREGQTDLKEEGSDKPANTKGEKDSKEKNDEPAVSSNKPSSKVDGSSNNNEEPQIKKDIANDNDSKKLEEDSKKLEQLQGKILNNFKEISPFMTQAEVLVEKMQNTAQTIQSKA